MSMHIGSGGQIRPPVTTTVDRPEPRPEQRPRAQTATAVAMRPAETRPAPESPPPTRNLPRGSVLDIKV